MTKIEWTERSWNPIVGCSVVSPGCTNCYAMRAAWRMGKNPGTPQYHGLTDMSKAGPVWNGKVALADRALAEPLKRRKPTMYFVNSMGDLFHESVPDEWIDKVFAVMALCPQHTFQVLTKRSARMREYLTADRRDQMNALAGTLFDWADMPEHVSWPLPNVWLGVSAEDQTRADDRIPDLLATPAAIRFVSCEPLLGAINMLVTDKRGHDISALRGIAVDPTDPDGADEYYYTGKLDWVIVGGESGPAARPMHPDWARSLRDQCADAGVPFFFKQWGNWLPYSQCQTAAQRKAVRATTIRSNKTGDGSQSYFGKAHARHPDGYLVTTTTPGIRPDQINRVGKKVAGRVLDGETWDQAPVRERKI